MLPPSDLKINIYTQVKPLDVGNLGALLTIVIKIKKSISKHIKENICLINFKNQTIYFKSKNRHK